MRKSNDEQTSIPAWVGEAIIAIGLLAFFLVIARPWYQSRAVRGWNVVSGQVISSQVKEEMGEGGAEFRPDIHYTYFIGGKQYEGKKYELLSWARPRDKAQSIVNLHPVGSAIEVRVNPQNHSEAIISGHFVLSWLALFISLGFIGMGTALLFDRR